MNMKLGELEARTILEKYGVEFDYTYNDDNCGKSKADLRYKNGRYLEVTHTRHNINIYNNINKYFYKTIDEQLQIEKDVSEALNRVLFSNYKSNGFTTEEYNEKQYNKDCKLLKRHLGYDPTSLEESNSEFGCDIPVIHFSADNIMREISKDKGAKYVEENIDLFIFVTEEEFNIFFELFNELNWNVCANDCIKEIINSPFSVIYICIWDIQNNLYNIDKPRIRKLEKTLDGGIKVSSPINI